MVDERKAPDGYKVTEVGIIPEDWDEIYLSKALLGSPKYGINAAAVDYTESLPTYLRITDISDDGRFIRSNKVSVDNESAENYYLEENDLVFARTGASTGKTYLYDSNDGELVYAGFLIKVSVDAKIMVPRFLKSYTQTGTYWNWVRVISMRSGQPGINGNEYSKLKLPLPPLSEQKAIAEALSDTDNLILSLEKLIDKKKKIKQGAMQQLLTGKKRLPGFSGEWEVRRLGDIVSINKGQLITEKDAQDGTIPVIAGGKKPSYYHSFPNRQGKTITISASGANAGYVGFYTEPIFASDCSTIGENDRYSIDFIYYQLLMLQESIYYAQTGGAQPHIHPKDLNPLLINYTNLKEQNAIAQVLSDMDAEIEALEEKLEKYKTIKQGMMQELLTGRIRLI